MKHGRKSKSERFDGYKEHIARDLDVPAILACAVTPANRPDGEGAGPIAADIDLQGFTLAEIHTDRAYINSPVVSEVVERGGSVFAKPWGQHAVRPRLFSKADFQIDPRAQTITCPGRSGRALRAGRDRPLRPRRMRCVSPLCELHRGCRWEGATRTGREALRARVAVESGRPSVSGGTGHELADLGAASLPFAPGHDDGKREGPG